MSRYGNNVVDLFSGAGGLSLGAARAGFSVRGAVEIDPHAISAHKKNFPGTFHLHDDVSCFSGQSIRDSFDLKNGDLAGIIGGPPCQGFSYIGRRDKEDCRNKLFIEFFRIVAESHPLFFLAENVPGLMHDQNKEIRDKAFSLVENQYVVLPPIIVSANEYGAPTTRKRIFFIGYLANEVAPLSVADFAPPPTVEHVFVKDALRGLPKRVNPLWQNDEQGWRIVHVYGNGHFASRLHGHIPLGMGDPVAVERLEKENRASGFLGTVHSTRVAERYAQTECGKTDPITRSCRLDPDGYCPTLRAGTGPDKGSFQAVRPLHPSENRVITIREAARLQGFPDWFQFSPTKWHSFRQIGSSVSPIVAEHVLSVILRSLVLRGGRRSHGAE